MDSRRGDEGLEYEAALEYTARMNDPHQPGNLTVMGWPTIIAITLAAGLATGIVLGFVFSMLGLHSAGIGAGIAVVEVLVLLSLLRRRQQALAARGKSDG
ncbi:MAG: hypothetical protein KF915_18690 [Polyangiaceae bacterium]|nr:hypothetical protein [Polyangiaceae bacterium]